MCPLKVGGEAPHSENLEPCGYTCEPGARSCSQPMEISTVMGAVLGLEGGEVKWPWGRAGPFFWSHCNFGRNGFGRLISFYCHTVEALSGRTPNPSDALQGRGVEGKRGRCSTPWQREEEWEGILHRWGLGVPGQRWAWNRALLNRCMAVAGWVHLHPRVNSKTWCLSGFSTEEIWEYIR